jgi:hypothetical protein
LWHVTHLSPRKSDGIGYTPKVLYGYQTMVLQLASHYLMRDFFFGASARRWCYEVCQGLPWRWTSDWLRWRLLNWERSQRVYYTSYVLLFRHRITQMMPQWFLANGAFVFSFRAYVLTTCIALMQRLDLCSHLEKKNLPNYTPETATEIYASKIFTIHKSTLCRSKKLQKKFKKRFFLQINTKLP